LNKYFYLLHLLFNVTSLQIFIICIFLENNTLYPPLYNIEVVATLQYMFTIVHNIYTSHVFSSLVVFH